MLFFAGLHEKHQRELENLTLTRQPFRTFKFFILAMIQYLKQSILYLLGHGVWLMLLSAALVLGGILLVNIDGPHEKVLQIFKCLQLVFGCYFIFKEHQHIRHSVVKSTRNLLLFSRKQMDKFIIARF